MKKKWFIYSQIMPESQKRAILFRKNFIYAGHTNDSANILIGITADARYQLYMNGKCLCRGPAVGDAHTRYYDEIDITAYLQEGTNCIAVRVLHYPAGDDGVQRFAFGPTALPGTYYGGLCVFSSHEEVDVHTDRSWKWREDTSYHFVESVLARYAGDVEYVDANEYPFGWELPEYDDAKWQNAVEVQETGEEESMDYGILRNWVLEKRQIPYLAEYEIQPAALHNCTKGIDFAGLLQGKSLTIPPDTTAVCEFDMGMMRTAYVRSEFAAQGAGSVSYLYSECYYRKEEDIYQKENREDWETGVLIGETDIVSLAKRDGSEKQSAEKTFADKAFVYEPFEYRTFRFLRLTVITEEAPVVIDSITFRQLDYPLRVSAEFTAEDKTLEKIWEVSVHTLRCCMKDTYMDCPFYERLQYIMDTMIEAAHTYPISGDDRLARKAMMHFAATQMPNGMIHCDAPANDRHVIPGFAIYFIDMLHQHYWYFKDEKLIQKYWGVCIRILDFFEERVHRASGLLGPCGYWEFVDWTDAWDSARGVPRDTPKGREKVTSNYIYSMQYAYGLKRMIELTEAIHGRDSAEIWRKRYERLVKAINEKVWDKKYGYYRTGAGERAFSEHAQVWAVLCGCMSGEAAKELLLRMAHDASLIKCSYCMQYYFYRAVEQAGLGWIGNGLIEQYRELLQKGLTTWPEDPVTARSDCHGWSTLPISMFCHVLLGVKPAQPGYEGLVIEPRGLELGTMAGSVQTPKGLVRVERKVVLQEHKQVLDLRIRLEQKQKVSLRLEGKEVAAQYCDELKYRTVLTGDGVLSAQKGEVWQ